MTLAGGLTLISSCLIFHFSYTRAKDSSAVYAIMLVWPDDDQLHLKFPQPQTSTKVTWLGYADPIEWKKGSSGGITLTLPKVSMTKIPCQYAWVFKMTGLENMQ